MKILRIISRFIVGITFIFSSIVKGVDPLGTMYKIEDYMIAFGWDSLISIALPMAFLVVLIEFLIGVFLLFNIRSKITAWAVLIVMSGFTLLTLNDAIFNPVSDCGCFGDAVKLTNWETFFKNVGLMVFTLIIFFTRKQSRMFFNFEVQNILGLVFGAFFLLFSYYNYIHLPMIDFRTWKVGSNMKQKGEPVYYLTYQNKETKEEKEYLATNLPWQDTVWTKQWEFKSQRIDESNVIRPHHLTIFDFGAKDHTKEIIENPDYQFIVTSSHLGESEEIGIQKIINLYQGLSQNAHFVLLTASLEEEVNEFWKHYNAYIPTYQSDDIDLKTMVRSNPGLILMKDGVILNKWHFNDIPTPEEIKNEFNDIP